MIKSINTKLSRTLLLLISFAMLFFITACGGSIDEGTAGTGSIKYSVAITSTGASLAAGESSIITATVVDGSGAPSVGQTVAFSVLTNNSGATSTTLNGGLTDAKGQAIAIYSAGTNSPATSVQDVIQASVTGATAVTKITRISSTAAATGLRMTLTADSTSLAAGQSTIITATVTEGTGTPASGQAVALTLLNDNSGATLTILSLGVTDNSGQAQAIYTAGANSPTTSVQDTIQASVTGATGILMITRISNSAAATGLRMTLTADSTSLAAGKSTLIKAMVTDGSGAPSVGQTVTFALRSNLSGATLVPLNGGTTDASGLAIATYTAGANSPTTSVQDIIQASVTGTTGAVIITRTSSSASQTGLQLVLTADKTSLAGGESTIIKAKVTDSTGAVQGEPVAFSFVTHPSGASLTILSATTDAAGEATVLYTAGTLSAATVQDIVQASITGTTKAIIITKTGTSSGATAASLDISASPTSIKSDGSTTSTITVNALNALNAALSGVVVTMGTDTGVLSAPTITTPGTVTLSSGGNKANRTATITATAGAVTATIPVQIVGSTVTLTSSGSTLPHDNTTTVTLTVTVKDAGDNAVSGATVNLTQTGAGSVTFGSASGTTNGSGKFTTTAMGATDGSVTITATALGATGTTTVTVTPIASTFAIDSLQINGGTPYYADPTSMKINTETLTIIVNAPSSANVTFATTIGGWDGGTSKVITKAVSGGQVQADLTTTLIGIANIQVYDAAAPATNDTLTVAMSSGAAPAKIILQASPTVVPVSVGSTSGSSTLTATVYDSSNNPLGGQPVSFEIVDGTSTSGGETITPVVVMTATTSSGGLSVGQARATFTSGSMPSAGTGVKIRSSVVGTAVVTGTAPSGNDVSIVIGGVAGSIAFGQATLIGVDSTTANYTWKMSVLVSDSNGNAVPGAVVSLGVRPIAWSTGLACTVDPDTATTGTFWNEDDNENLILDAGEDGWRHYYSDPTKVLSTPGGTLDGLITPTNSAGGSVPSSVITDANGVAGFTLTYPKQSALWTVDRIRATTIVQGTETRSQIILTLPCLEGDISPVCRLGNSPYTF